MKKFRFRFTKTLLFAILLIPYFSSCQDDEPKQNSQKELMNLKVLVGTEEFKPQLQSDGETWRSPVDLNYDHELLKTATIIFSLPKGAAAYPHSGATVDLSEPVTISVRAEDGSTFFYSIEMVDGTSSLASFFSFSLQVGNQTIEGIIDNKNSKVNLNVIPSMMFRLADAVPFFTLAVGAATDTESGVTQDFTKPVKYVLTAHDGTSREWTIDIQPEELGTMLEYFENSSDDSRTIYCDAVRRAGLADVIAAGNITCVVPNNNAWNTFLNRIGATSINQVEPVLLKYILQYLIFPGDYRSIDMIPNENHKATSLTGDPIWIARNPSGNDKYRVLINDNAVELANLPVTVSQQDYLFDHQVVAHVVPELITFMPKVEQKDNKPSGFVNPNNITLSVSDDTYIWNNASYVGTNYNNNQNGVRMSYSVAGERRIPIFKFPLTGVIFKEDILSATLITRVSHIDGYSVGQECTINVRELHKSGWTETNATWTSVIGARAASIDPLTTIINSTKFTVTGNTQEYFETNPLYLYTDITSSIIKYYRKDSVRISLLLDDISTNNSANNIINLYDKDRRKYTSIIELERPYQSAMTLARNNPVVVSNNIAILNPDIHFAMAGPAVPNGYNYKDANIIYTVKTLPTNGILTVYGIPVKVDSRFSQAEMRAGVVKYFRTTATTTSIVLNVLDYLGGMYYANESTNTITVNVN